MIKKYLPLILVGVGVLILIIVAVLIFKSKNRSETPEEESIPELSEAQWPAVSLTPKK